MTHQRPAHRPKYPRGYIRRSRPHQQSSFFESLFHFAYTSSPQLNCAVYNGLVRVTSTAFLEGGTIPIKNTCDGIDVSPPLRWEDVPEGTKSFALSVTDPDAPMEFIHWLVCDLPADARLIPEGGPVPTGAKEIRNDFGKEAYGGPCPPTGEHHYHFTIYALDTDSLLARQENFVELCRKHMIEKAELIGVYWRGAHGEI